MEFEEFESAALQNEKWVELIILRNPELLSIVLEACGPAFHRFMATQAQKEHQMGSVLRSIKQSFRMKSLDKEVKAILLGLIEDAINGRSV